MDKFEQRRDRFALFDGMDSPSVNLCFPLALPDFRPWCKAQDLAPFHVLLCAVLRAVLKIENFRYRIHDGEVIRIERLIPSFTVKNLNDDLNFATFDWSDDLREFVARGRAAGIEAMGMAGLNQHYAGLSPRDAKDQVFVTCIPWLEFTAIQHPTSRVGRSDIPSLAWGRFKDGPEGKLVLPFSVQAHHGFVDGFHIYTLGQQIGAELAAMMASTSPAAAHTRAG
jgi:chloramphenicol O-acetyltransferase type A